MKFSNFMNGLLTNLIPPPPKKKKSKLAIISSLKFMFKKLRVSPYLMVPTNEFSKFKLDCVKSKNSYILLMDVINFKLRLINFLYLF